MVGMILTRITPHLINIHVPHLIHNVPLQDDLGILLVVMGIQADFHLFLIQ